MRGVRPLTIRRGRSRVERAAQAALSLLVLGAVGCAAFEDEEPATERASTPPSGTLTIAAQRGEARATWAEGPRLRLADGRTIKLARSVNTTLTATLAPVAVADAREKLVAYNSWRGRRPTIRVRRLRGASDVELDAGAHSPAWRRDGAIAHFKALRPELGDPRRYLGHVVVRESLGARVRPWTPRAGRYVVAAWAQRRLLVYRLGRSFPDLLVLDGPRRQRVLARGTALVALSPDGRRAFLSRYGASPPVVHVVDVASGGELARLRVPRDRVRYVTESGSWIDDVVVAATTTGLAAFRVEKRAIRLEQVLRAGAGFPLGLWEPRVSADERVVAWGELESRPRQAIPETVLIDCDRLTMSCVRVATGTQVTPPRPVYNPSRP